MNKYLTQHQRNLISFVMMENKETMSNIAELKAFENRLIQDIKDIPDHECRTRLEYEIEGKRWDRASDVAYEQLCEDGQLNSLDFNEQFEKLTEKIAEDFRYEKLEYAQCEDGYYL